MEILGMDAPSPSSIGNLVVELRQSKRWTQSTLAEKSSVPVRTIQRIEEGKTKRPNAVTLRYLATAFGIEVEVLKEACWHTLASNAIQSADSLRDTDEMFPGILQGNTEPKETLRHTWKLPHKVLFYLFIITVPLGGIIFICLQKEAVVPMIGSALGVVAACNITLILTHNFRSIKQQLHRWLKFFEATYGKGMAYYLVFINVFFLLLAIFALIIIPWVQSDSVNFSPISGKVSCIGNEQVEGIWVQATNDGSGWADKHQTDSDGAVVVFTYVLPNGGAYNLHVGCGGSEQHWNTISTTEAGSGTIQDHTFHFFTCQDSLRAVGYGSCRLQY